MPVGREGIRETTGGTAVQQQSPYRDKKIQAGLSTQIVIEAQGNDGIFYPVGAVQNFAVTETRTITPIVEVGTDGIIELVPTAAATYALTVNRMVFDYQRLPASFQRGFRHLQAARLPFDLVVRDYNPYREVGNFEGGLANAIVTRWVNCWIASYGYTYDNSNFLITENATISCETVFDNVPSGTTDIAVGGDDLVERSNNDSPLSNTFAEAFLIPPGAGEFPAGT